MTENRVERKFIFGLDLGQTNDYTALIVLERSQNIVAEWANVTGDRVVNGADLQEKTIVEDAIYHCRKIERLKLGTPYPAIVDYVKTLIEDPVIEGKYMLVVDQTGVGRPVFDLVNKAGLTAVGVTITGGDKAEFKSRTEARVAKRLLVSTVQAVLQTRRLLFAADMPFVDAITKELLDFRVKINDNANDVYAAREGQHDDLVMALALSLWFGEKYGNPKKKAKSYQGLIFGSMAK